MKKIILVIAGMLLVLSFTGCEKTTGDKVDDAMDSTKDASQNLLDKAKKALDN